MLHKILLAIPLVLLANCGESSEDVASVSSIAQAIYTGPVLKLPLPTGYKWKITTEASTGYCGKNTDGSNCYDSYHINHYAIDFARTAENNHATTHIFDDGVVDILAAAEGTVVEATPPGSGCKKYGTMCAVVISHAGDYTTHYFHFTDNTIVVSKGDHVEQGQVLGKMGTTGESSGTHLHFEVKHKGSSLTSKTELSGLMLNENDFLRDYKYGSFISSSNGFTLPLFPDNPHTCSNEPVGGMPCTPAANFYVGQKVWSYLQLDKVTKDICFKIQLYLGNVKKAETNEGCSNTVETDGGWDHAYLWGNLVPSEVSTNWNTRYFVRLKNSGASYLPEPAGMGVTSNFTVRNAPIPSTPTLISPISIPAFPPTTKVKASPITLQWTASTGATSYNVGFLIWTGSEWRQVGFWNVPGSPIDISGVPTYTGCAWVTQACNASGCSGWSDTGYFQTVP